MLALKRNEGQWVEVTHAASGDVLRIRVYDIGGGFVPHAKLAFDDDVRNFVIHRPERRDGCPIPRASSPR